MTTQEIALIFSFSLSIFLFLLVLINAIYFYLRHYKGIAEKIDGAYLNMGFLFSANRLMLWAHYCLFPERAKRENVYTIFFDLQKSVRFQLLFHWFGVISGILLLIAGALINIQ